MLVLLSFIGELEKIRWRRRGQRYHETQGQIDKFEILHKKD